MYTSERLSVLESPTGSSPARAGTPLRSGPPPPPSKGEGLPCNPQPSASLPVIWREGGTTGEGAAVDKERAGYKVQDEGRISSMLPSRLYTAGRHLDPAPFPGRSLQHHPDAADDPRAGVRAQAPGEQAHRSFTSVRADGRGDGQLAPGGDQPPRSAAMSTILSTSGMGGQGTTGVEEG